MHTVKSVGVLSVARIMGLIYGCLGLLFTPLFLLIGLLGSVAGRQKTPFAGIVGVVIAIFMPVFYGLMGFVGGAIASLLYNAFAKWVGGFQLELELGPAAPVAPYPLVPPVNPVS